MLLEHELFVNTLKTKSTSSANAVVSGQQRSSSGSGGRSQATDGASQATDGATPLSHTDTSDLDEAFIVDFLSGDPCLRGVGLDWESTCDIILPKELVSLRIDCLEYTSTTYIIMFGRIGYQYQMHHGSFSPHIGIWLVATPSMLWTVCEADPYSKWHSAVGANSIIMMHVTFDILVPVTPWNK